MIFEVSGDILKSKAQAIALNVAADDHFNTGLALSLREMWPSMYKDFRHYSQTHHPKAGQVWAWAGADGKRILNLLTQDAAKDQNSSHSSKSTYENVRHALKELRKIIESEGIKSVALPKIATGHGGLEWNEVYNIIKNQLGDIDAKVYIYTNYKKDSAGNEVM